MRLKAETILEVMESAVEEVELRVVTAVGIKGAGIGAFNLAVVSRG